MLLGFYGRLLTEKQYDALDLYCNMDFSLAEIAENIGVTRQCVRDFIKKGEAHLLDIEENVKLCSKFKTISMLAEKIQNAADGISEKSKDELLEAEREIKENVSAIVSNMEI